jgi:hypothetical protein
MSQAWCSRGSAHEPIPLQDIVAHQKQTAGQRRKEVAMNDPSLWVSQAPHRASTMGPNDQHDMWGCFGKKRSCKHAMPSHQASRLDDLTAKLSKWADALGKTEVHKSASLACMRGIHATNGTKKDVVVLLVMARYSPKIQFFVRCTFKSMDGEPSDMMPDAMPFIASLGVARSRLGDHHEALDIVTSEELAVDLSSMELAWELRPLKWELPEKRQLTDHIVTNVEDAFEFNYIEKRNVMSDFDLTGLEFEEDPHDSGRKVGMSQRQGAPPSIGTKSSAEPLPDEPVLAFQETEGPEEDEEERLFEGVHLEDRYAVCEQLFDDMLPDSEGANLAGEPIGDVLVEEPPSDGSEAFGELDGTVTAAEEPEPIVYTPEAAVAFCIRSPMGYVSCSVPPWNGKPYFARITMWPDSVPEENRNMQATCYLHSACRTPGTTRKKCTLEQMFLWCLKGAWEPTAPVARRKILAAQHKTMFHAVLAPPETAAAAASSS